MKRKIKDIIGKPIKEYRLPLIDRLAYYRPVLIWFFWLSLTAMIVGPTIYLNYENGWYYLAIAPLIFFFVISIVSLIRFWYYSYAYHELIAQEAESDSAYENFTGPPGSGKSYSAKEITYAMSQYAWEEIQFSYWCIASKLRNAEYEPTEEEQEIIDSYEFYSKGNGIPCFASNIPCYSKRYKRYSYKFETAHLKQQKRLAFRTCGFVDEIGTTGNFNLARGVETNRDNATDADDFARLLRHFGEFRLRATEQDGENIAIFLRRVAGDNKRFDRKQWVLKPRFLFWIYTKLRKHFVKHMRYSEAKLFGKFMKNLKKYIFSCGFFKLTYTSCGNLQTTGRIDKIVLVMKEKKTFFFFPRASEVVYDTRAYQNAYKPLNQSIDLSVFYKMKLMREEAKSMLKSENLSNSKKDEETEKTTSSVLQF